MTPPGDREENRKSLSAQRLVVGLWAPGGIGATVSHCYVGAWR